MARPSRPSGAPGAGLTALHGGPVRRFEDGGFEQEAAHVLGLVSQHLVGEVVHDVPVVAGESGDERRGVASPAQREQVLERCRSTSVRASGGRDVVVAEAEALQVVEVARDLLGGEAQVGGTDLEGGTASPQPRQRQGGVGSGADDRARSGGGRWSTRNVNASAMSGPSARW